MQNSLIESAYEVPYNNFTWILARQGESYPDSLGGDCIYQSRDLVRRLKAEGYDDVGYLKVIGGDHHAVVCTHEGEDFFMDSNLFQREPLSLTRLFAEDQEMFAESNPKLADHYSKIAFRKLPGPGRRFCVMCQTRIAGAVQWINAGTYDLDQRLAQSVDLKRALSQIDPDSFKMKFLNNDGGVTGLSFNQFGSEQGFELKVLGADSIIRTNIREQVASLLLPKLNRFNLTMEDLEHLMQRAKEICGV